MMRLLFTGGGGAGNEAINRLWAGRYIMHFADANVATISPTISADHAHAIVCANDCRFADGLAELCLDLAIDVLIPGVDEELPFMPRLAELANKTNILVPHAGYVRTMLDKLDMATILSAYGIPVPNTVLLGDAAKLDFPCIAKPRRGRGSRGFAVLQNAVAAHAYGDLFGAEDKIAQELLVGQEYTVLMAADRNACLRAIVPVRVLNKRGITISAVTDNNKAVIDACLAIHQAQPTEGCYNIQLMLCDDGRVMPFEINPRISTTFCLAIAAGIDPVSLYFCVDEDKGLNQCEAGKKLSRHWSNVISTMGED